MSKKPDAETPAPETEPTDAPAADEQPPVVHHLDEDWADTESVPAAQAGRALEEAEDRFLRLAAEYDNYRRRTTREKAESFDRGASDFAMRLLDVLDDVDRLAASDPATTDYQAYRDAFELIVKKLGKELSTGGLERIDPTGTKFDPNDQDAVAIATPDDAALDDIVKATFQVGYRFRGTVIRPAKVQVWSIDGSL
ncbi:MAG: nucleotide exchange factor GrpE [Gemmatimonadetes bacterium]|nr:nucleotide exchange factor GrpE [Gemmatimonadota bacterium]MCB9505221.1 nucleotide exchange factor GrpE [Gemmatimonadales bacterium]MCB9518308.1 nucleotide exchange factor GrpE [Gemmatimonadales bacterium]HPF63026.1 nucleotide exchange factor GrpE [Gemmatimonadales bacterium]